MHAHERAHAHAHTGAQGGHMGHRGTGAQGHEDTGHRGTGGTVARGHRGTGAQGHGGVLHVLRSRAHVMLLQMLIADVLHVHAHCGRSHAHTRTQNKDRTHSMYMTYCTHSVSTQASCPSLTRRPPHHHPTNAGSSFVPLATLAAVLLVKLRYYYCDYYCLPLPRCRDLSAKL